MKKRIVSVIFCIALALLMTACFAEDAPLEETVQIPNPFTECDTLEQAEEAAGFPMTAPDAVAGYTEKQISVMEKQLIQVWFSNGDRELLLRKCRGVEDCSGDYNAYSQTSETDVDGVTVTMKGEDGRVKLAVWTVGDYAYSIGAYGAEGISMEEMTALIGQLR